METFNDAVRRRDLVAFGQILRTRGIIGTGDVDEARQKLEGEVYLVADHLKLKNQGEMDTISMSIRFATEGSRRPTEN